MATTISKKSGGQMIHEANDTSLMFADLDYTQEEVKQDVKNWGEWIVKTARISGIRFDAVKHFGEDFLREFLQHLDQTVGPRPFYVGEFWKDSLSDMSGYLERMGHKFSLFDAPLVYNFSKLSKEASADLRTVFDNTLVQIEPVNAVTLVMNHDTQPYQALEAPIEAWFKPLAYALILLRSSGYPCLFYGDVYGIKGEHPFPPSCQGKVPDMALARKLYAYGEEDNYFDPGTCIGWVRRGTSDRPSGLACVLSNAGINEKRMFVGTDHKGEKWTDLLGWETSEVCIGDDGFAMFPVGATSVAIWVNEKAEGRDRFGKL
jgi:alpha-amylase